MKQNIYDHPEFFESYRKLRESELNYNDLLEQPTLRDMLPELKNKKVLDVGCGMGDFAKYCVNEQAREVLAIDISKNMINVAQQRNAHERINYVNISLEDLQIRQQDFDVAVSSLALHYIRDYDAVIKKMNGCLKKMGVFLFSIEHPIATARRNMDNWIIDKENSRSHYAVDHYQEEGERQQHWYIDGVVKYHRTFSTLINELILNGFQIEKVIEPIPADEAADSLPKIMNELRRPSFMIIRAKKAW
ncbi:class I SAM-dependent methyltransferase [Bacillus sp. mrc49]|uniref:class I SAM-dependent methyltransferase n=1 Tax=Bacillus sp. mrc49 TaxID=2054913 RepID=UPI000C26F1C8|nr:class I SAM-dependent methyltransferase [Bacillus sp. mrc49]PJN90715.1 SAM-dependent methyltransferase [Bacillus sp. mrc49]